jgi:predicted phage terminase large subunit-like protein
MALEITDTELLFGGAAGGGKSDFLLQAALQFVDVPDYSALVLRRSFSDLEKPGALIPRSHEWLRHTPARWHGSTRSWAFPSGATLSFGYLENESDVYQYQGAEFTFCGFDELTQFSEAQFRYLFSRLRRRAGSKVPIRMRATSNPGGIGHRWVKERFVSNNIAEGRWFIPSKIADNPSLDEADYRKSLSHLDHITRLQLEEGDWDVVSGGLLFQRQWFRVVDQAPATARRCRHWDLAATKPKQGHDADWTVGVLMGRTADGHYCIEDIRRTQNTPLEVERLIRQTADTDGREVMVSIEQEPGAGGVNTIDHYQRVVLAGFHFEKNKPTTNKAARANPLSSAAEAGHVSIVRGQWNTAFLDEVELFPQGDHDDQIDSASGAMQMITTTRGAIDDADLVSIGGGAMSNRWRR